MVCPWSYRMWLLLSQRTAQRQARRKTVTLPQTFMNTAFRQLRKQHLIVFWPASLLPQLLIIFLASMIYILFLFLHKIWSAAMQVFLQSFPFQYATQGTAEIKLLKFDRTKILPSSCHCNYSPLHRYIIHSNKYRKSYTRDIAYTCFSFSLFPPTPTSLRKKE